VAKKRSEAKRTRDRSKRSALTDGCRRTFRGLRFVFLLYFCNLGIAAVLGYHVFGSLEDSLGDSAASEQMVEEFAPHWYDGFRQDAQGLARTFSPAYSGIGALLEPVDAMVSGQIFRRDVALLGAAGLYLLLWTFLGGGLLWYFQRLRREGTFFGHCGRLFLRMLVISVFAAGAFFALYKYGLPWVEATARGFTRDLDDERWYALVVLAKTLLVLLALALVDLLFTYSRVVTVVRNQRFVPFAFFRALWFVVTHPLRCLGLYLVITLVWLVLFAAYALFQEFHTRLVDPGTWTGIAVLLGAGQLFILSRVFLKCLVLASHTALYENACGLPAAAPGQPGPRSAFAEPPRPEPPETASGAHEMEKEPRPSSIPLASGPPPGGPEKELEPDMAMVDEDVELEEEKSDRPDDASRRPL